MALAEHPDIIKSNSSGSESLREPYYQPCCADGKNLEAEGFCVNCQEHLCPECFKYHTKPTITRHHVLIGKKKSLRNTLRKKSFLRKSKCEERCEEHADKTIKYFCPVHAYLGCSACMTLYHRNCEDMQYIPDASKEITSSEEYREFESKLKQIADDSNEILSEIKQRTELAEKYNTDALNSVIEFRKEINDILDKLETDIKSKLEQIKVEDVLELKETSDKFTATITEVQLISHQFRILNNNKQNSTTYIAMKKANHRLETLEDEVKKAKSEARNARELKQYNFQPNKEILESLKQFETFGKMNVQNNMITMVMDINVGLESDVGDSWISGSAILPDNKLVLADRNNKKIKVVDIFQKVVTSEFDLSGRPWDLAKVNDSQVVVSLPNRKKLLFMKTDPSLEIDHYISVKEPCYGVIYTNGTLIVTYAGNHMVDILDTKGTVLKSISKSNAGPQLFYTPCYVAMSPDLQTIYVSNSGNNSVVSLTLDGKILASYADKDLKHPRQVIVDTTGMVYICAASSKIHQISANCKKVGLLLTDADGVFQPFSISYDDTAGIFYIGMENSNSIKVFRVTQVAI